MRRTIEQLLRSRGCAIQTDDHGNETIVVPRGALGIKALGYLDSLRKPYYFTGERRCPPPPPPPLSRRVSRVRVRVNA